VRESGLAEVSHRIGTGDLIQQVGALIGSQSLSVCLAFVSTHD
jgi:hypothetical protein